MAQVPVYGNRQVLPEVIAPRQSSIASPQLFSAGSENVMQAGKGIAALGVVAARAKEFEDADTIMRAETALKEDYIKFETELRERKGQNAWGATSDTEKWWEDKGKSYMENMDDRQKQLFQKTMGNLRLQSLEFANKHEANERRSSLEESTKSSIVGSINLAAANANDPEVVGEAKRDVLKRLDMLANMGGWTPERKEVEAQTYLTNMHKQVIQQMSINNPKGASEYFQANKAEIEGRDRAEIEKTLATGKTTLIAQETADKLTQLRFSEQEGLDYIRQSLEGEEEKAAVAEWKTRSAEVANARERTQRTAADTAWGIFARTGSINKIPPDVLSALDGKDLMAIRKEQEERIEKLKNKEPKYPITDWDRYYELKQEAFQDPQAFAQRDLRREFPYLDKAARESLITLQGKASKPTEIKDAATLSQQLSNMHDLLKLGGANNQEKRGQFDMVVTEAIEAEQERLGKKLNYKERQEIIDRYAMEGEVPGRWFGTNTVRAYEVVGNEKGNQFTPKDPASFYANLKLTDIPQADQTAIKAELKKRGKVATPQEIIRLYKRGKGVE